MTRTGWIIAVLTGTIVLLVGAFMFMVGRATAPGEAIQNPTKSPASFVTEPAATPPVATPVVAQAAVPKEATPPRGPWEKYAPIPAAFLGVWNTNIENCGTGLNDSRLRIEPKRVRFYESDAEVKRVVIHNARAITVEGSFAGEGEVWKNTFRMVLSRSGNDLSIDGSDRHRCPKST